MQHLQHMEEVRRAIRSAVCTKCDQRPEGSESLPPSIPRSCEGACPIFANLPHLRTIALRTHNRLLTPYECAVRDVVCQHCKATTTSGDFCNANLTRDCPLSRYLGDVMSVLERVLALPRGDRNSARSGSEAKP